MTILTLYSFHYIIPGALNIAVLSVFNTLLLVNFFRKRTIGTVLLFFAYFSLWLNEVLVTAAFLMEAYFYSYYVCKGNAYYWSAVFSLYYQLDLFLW